MIKDMTTQNSRQTADIRRHHPTGPCRREFKKKAVAWHFNARKKQSPAHKMTADFIPMS
jgi:hypothetical protein